jgi:hypothetical protein
MANTFTSYVAKDVGTSPATLLTVASSTVDTVLGLSVANTSASGITVDVYITRSAVNYYIVKGAYVPPGQTFIMSGGDQKIVLVTADVLKVVSSAAASADAIASVLEMT